MDIDIIVHLLSLLPGTPFPHITTLHALHIDSTLRYSDQQKCRSFLLDESNTRFQQVCETSNALGVLVSS